MTKLAASPAVNFAPRALRVSSVVTLSIIGLLLLSEDG